MKYIAIPIRYLLMLIAYLVCMALWIPYVALKELVKTYRIFHTQFFEFQKEHYSTKN